MVMFTRPPLPDSFGALLRRYREALGLTQEELAERAALTERGLRYLERDLRRPYRDTVRRLAATLGLTPEERTFFEAAARRPAAASEAAVVRSHVSGPAAPSPLVHPLPIPPSPLIGRTCEVAEVAGLLDAADARLLTLTGPGGVGKTRLALAVAHAVADRYADGAVFVPLALLRAPDVVGAALATALDVGEGGGRSLPEALRGSLRDKRLLLILDNFEHVLAAAPLVADLLATCPGLRVLVTSRSRLRLTGERVYAVAPLSTPDPARLPALPALAEVPAVALLVQRARAAAADFALDTANASAIAALCTHLEGLPLALELAAPRLAVLSPEMLLRRLTPRLGLLTDGARDLPERQRTLRATLEWSYTLLGPGEQAVFRRLSVFAGGCALEAAEAVGTLDGGEAEDTLFAGRDVADRLGALIDKSLVRRERGADGVPRFGMLETVREYGLDALAETGEAERARRAHALHYLALAEEAEPALIGPEQVAWGERLEREHDNLCAALAWACAAGDAVTAVRLAGALWRFWLVRGRLSEGRAWLERALDAGSGALPAPRVKALNGAGYLAWAQGDYRRATVAHGESLAVARAMGDPMGIASALNNLGLVADEQGDYARAGALFAESLRMRRELGDTVGVANSLNNLGRVAGEQGDYTRAGALFAESLRLRRELGDTWSIAISLINLGAAAGEQGDYARAAALFEESLRLRRELRDTWGVTTALEKLGRVAYEQGDYARAKALFAEGLAAGRSLGHMPSIATSLANLGRVAYEQEDYARAAALFEESLTMGRGLEDKRSVAISLIDLAAVAHAQGDNARATALLDESLAVLRGLPGPSFRAHAIEEIGGLVGVQGQAAAATRLFGAAAALREASGTPVAPSRHGRRERAVVAARGTLGEDAFATAWAAGRTLAPEQAIAEALEELRWHSGRRLEEARATGAGRADGVS